MSKCPDCKGRGHWQTMEYNLDGGVITSHWCNTCAGTGVNLDPEEGDDFDIGGSSFAEED